MRGPSAPATRRGRSASGRVSAAARIVDSAGERSQPAGSVHQCRATTAPNSVRTESLQVAPEVAPRCRNEALDAPSGQPSEVVYCSRQHAQSAVGVDPKRRALRRRVQLPWRAARRDRGGVAHVAHRVCRLTEFLPSVSAPLRAADESRQSGLGRSAPSDAHGGDADTQETQRPRLGYGIGLELQVFPEHSVRGRDRVGLVQLDAQDAGTRGK